MKKRLLILCCILFGGLIGFAIFAAKPVQRGFAKGWLEIGYSEDTAIALGNTQLAAYFHSKVVNGHTSFNQDGIVRGFLAKYLEYKAQTLPLYLPQSDRVLVELLTEWMPLYHDPVNAKYLFPLDVRQKKAQEALAFQGSLMNAVFSKEWLNKDGKLAMSTIVLGYIDYHKENFSDFNQIFNFVEELEKTIPQFSGFKKEDARGYPFYQLGRYPEVFYWHYLSSLLNSHLIRQNKTILCSTYEKMLPVLDSYHAVVVRTSFASDDLKKEMLRGESFLRKNINSIKNDCGEK